MSGSKYFFDTNALVGLFDGNSNLSQYTLQENKIHLSIISVLEFLSYQHRTEVEKKIFTEFCEQSNVVDLNFNDYELLDIITLLRKKYKLKLPDSIIAASAINEKAILVTNDSHFANIANLRILTF